MNHIFPLLRRRGVKTWIYIILILQCCLLCAYVSLFHGTSSSRAAYDVLSEVTTGDRKRKSADQSLRQITTQVSGKSERVSTGEEHSGKSVEGRAVVNVIKQRLGPREIVVFTLPPTVTPGHNNNKDIIRESNKTLGKWRESAKQTTGGGGGGETNMAAGDAQAVTVIHNNDNNTSDSNRSVVESAESVARLTVLYQNYSSVKLNFSGNLQPILGLNSDRSYILQNVTSASFFRRRANTSCLDMGTDVTSNASGACFCNPGWFGAQCTIPSTVYLLGGINKFAEGLKVRKTPRRIINAIAFNIEFELLEARLHDLWDLVDVFVILESSFSHYGEPKPLRLLDRLLKGYLEKYHSKICYLIMPHFPDGARENGWIMDQYHRTFIGRVSMQHLAGMRKDDIYMYTDADEIPSRDSLLFLKLHDGYPEPFGLSLRWSVFGFFWKQFDTTRVMVGCTVGMLRYVFQNDVYQLRANTYHSRDADLRSYVQSTGSLVFDWYIADNGGFAGWHCSWCLRPEGIQVKLTSAINADFPRWGNYPEKRDIEYIKKLIHTGTWFDDKSSFGTLVTNETDDYLAPRYLIENYSEYKYLLDVNFAG